MNYGCLHIFRMTLVWFLLAYSLGIHNDIYLVVNESFQFTEK